MPIYMDSHIVPGIEAKHAAEAHKKDLGIQNQFGCRNMTYWVDEDRGRVFCLIDAPNEEAVRDMHNHSHGQVPHEIIPVNGKVVEAFLGRIADPETYFDPGEPGLQIFNDPAFRIILVSETKDIRLMQHELGKDKASKLITIYHEIMRTSLQKYEGREVELEGEGFIGSFVSVTQAVNCAEAIQKGLHVAGELIDLKIGINAGMPVSKSKSIFGETVLLAKFFCRFVQDTQIVMAPIIHEIYKDDGQHTTNGQTLFKWISPADENFLRLLMDTIKENWDNSKFSVSDFGHKMCLSKSKLFRTSTELTGMSPNNFLREYRLLKSLDLLKTDRSICETTYDAGFTSPSYFTKCFQKRFGIPPLFYQKDLK